MNDVSSTGSPCYEVYGPAPTTGARTYVVLGVPRGGTSMVAGLARLCGLYLGDDLPNNHEDPAFNANFLRRDGVEPIPAISEAIVRRNAEREVWGWKFPRSEHFLDEVRPLLREPRLVLVLRDPVASAGRGISRSAEPPMDIISAHHRLQARNLDLVARWQVPTLLVSYERAIDRPEELSTRLADFLGLPRPAESERVRAFVRPGTYQEV